MTEDIQDPEFHRINSVWLWDTATHRAIAAYLFDESGRFLAYISAPDLNSADRTRCGVVAEHYRTRAVRPIHLEDPTAELTADEIRRRGDVLEAYFESGWLATLGLQTMQGGHVVHTADPGDSHHLSNYVQHLTTKMAEIAAELGARSSEGHSL